MKKEKKSKIFTIVWKMCYSNCNITFHPKFQFKTCFDLLYKSKFHNLYLSEIPQKVDKFQLNMNT